MYKPKKTSTQSKSHYKTVQCKNFEMCKTLTSDGHCRFGDKCTFAHGVYDTHDFKAKGGTSTEPAVVVQHGGMQPELP